MNKLRVTDYRRYDGNTSKLPKAEDPQANDVWRAKDGRLIVVYSADDDRVGAFVNGEQLMSFTRLWSHFLLSLEAEAVGKVEQA